MPKHQVAASKDFTFEIPRVGRDVSDDGWKEIDAAHIDFWKEARSSLATRTIEFDGQQIRVQVDWSPIIRRLRHSYGVMQRLFAATGDHKAKDIIYEFRLTSVRVPCRVFSTAQSVDEIAIWRLVAVLQAFIYDVFLIMNIAAPGSCNFYNASLRSKDTHSPKILLSGAPFEIAFLNAQDNRWPYPKTIPLEAVRKWFFAVRTDLAQVPRNRMEKVLFGLLHISATDLSATTVIWLFYALETLFDTKAGENFRGLIDRIRLLLSPNEKQLPALRKNLRTMYDLRSAFVHGGLEVIHPMHNEVLDRTVDKRYGELMRTFDFGFSLLLTAVQEVIMKGWSAPQFEEVLRGQSL